MFAENWLHHLPLGDEGLDQGYHRNRPVCRDHQASPVRHYGQDKNRSQQALQIWWVKQL